VRWTDVSPPLMRLAKLSANHPEVLGRAISSGL
jgi:hypothetical protein